MVMITRQRDKGDIIDPVTLGSTVEGRTWAGYEELSLLLGK